MKYTDEQWAKMGERERALHVADECVIKHRKEQEQEIFVGSPPRWASIVLARLLRKSDSLAAEAVAKEAARWQAIIVKGVPAESLAIHDAQVAAKAVEPWKDAIRTAHDRLSESNVFLRDAGIHSIMCGLSNALSPATATQHDPDCPGTPCVHKNYCPASAPKEEDNPIPGSLDTDIKWVREDRDRWQKIAIDHTEKIRHASIIGRASGYDGHWETTAGQMLMALDPISPVPSPKCSCPNPELHRQLADGRPIDPSKCAPKDEKP